MRTVERVLIVGIVLISMGLVAEVLFGRWDRVGSRVALLAILVARLFVERAKRTGGRLTRGGLVVILSVSAVALALVPIEVKVADNSLDLVLGGVMYLAAAMAVVMTLVSSQRGELRRPPR